MSGLAVEKSVDLSESQRVTRNTGNIAATKIWLPKLIYDALPWFYLTAGFAAFLATVYVSEWFWVLPHYLVFSVACVQLGVSVYIRRKLRRDT